MSNVTHTYRHMDKTVVVQEYTHGSRKIVRDRAFSSKATTIFASNSISYSICSVSEVMYSSVLKNRFLTITCLKHFYRAVSLSIIKLQLNKQIISKPTFTY